MAAKKKKKAKAPAKRAAPAVKETDAQFVGFLNDTFAQVEGSLKGVQDPEQKKVLGARLKALRSKFRGLPKEKKTAARAQTYGEELHKIATDIQSACRDC
jgi:hypothetical protein